MSDHVIGGNPGWSCYDVAMRSYPSIGDVTISGFKIGVVELSYADYGGKVHHIRDLIEHPQYEPESEFPW